MWNVNNKILKNKCCFKYFRMEDLTKLPKNGVRKLF